MEVGLAVGSSVLSAFLQVLFDRIASSSKFVDLFQGGKTIKIDDRIASFPSLLDKLKRSLQNISLVLDDAENKQEKFPAVRRWLEGLKDSVYQADDLLDEINTEALRLKVEAEFEGRETKVCDLNFSFNDEFFKDVMPKIENVSASLQNYVEEVKYLGLEPIISKKVASSRLPSTSLVDVSGVFGRDVEREELIRMVCCDDARASNLSVIPVVGLGGIGKTTLAQLVYNHENVQKEFDMRRWVCVSEDYDPIKVTKNLLGEDCSSSADFDGLQVKLKERLTGKKFLIVLDDIWNDNYNDWDRLRAPLKHGRQGSKIIITTRSFKVAKMMQDVPLLHVKEISDEESWSLFKTHACTDGAQGLSPEFETIGKEIVKKCKGLPLAVKAVGGALRSKRDVTEWHDFLRSEVWASGDKSDILPALSLSYHYLPSDLKRCFAFCAIYPKDFPFQKEEVVLLWMANDLVRPSTDLNGKSIEDVGHECFNELISRSFFQKMSDNRYVMHDLVNDLARYVSGKFCVRREDYQAKEIPKEVRHFAYLPDVYNPHNGFKSLVEVQSLRTFLTLRIRYLPQRLTPLFFSDTLPRFQCIRVLTLCDYDFEEIPDSVGYLKHLRLLNMSQTFIKRLPNSLCNLVNLQTLLLAYCYNLVELPADMRKLIKLRHLDVRGTRLRNMTRQLSRLQDLQNLSTFLVDNYDGRSIGELGELQLHGYLEIEKLQNVISADNARKAKLSSKNHIEELVLRWSDGEVDDSNRELDILAKLRPHINLKRLIINGYRGTRFPNWVGDISFCNMVSLHVENCVNCFSLPAFGQLPYLKDLVISGMGGISTLGQEFYGDGSVTKPFQSLVTLKFKGMNEWEKWDTPEDVEFSSLEELIISSCPKLVRKLPSRLFVLRKLEIRGCRRFVLDDDWMTCFLNDQLSSLQVVIISDMPSLKGLPDKLIKLNLKELEITRCQRFISFPKEIIQVDHLHIAGCPSLTCLPQSAAMKRLSILDCVSLEFPTDGNCNRSLETLSMSGVGKSSINGFPVASFPNLRWLYITDWQSPKLLKISGGGLPALRSLKITNYNMLSFPEGGLPAPNLVTLFVEHCPKLKSLPEQMHTLLPSLRDLQIWKCPEIEGFPEGGLPSSLQSLSVDKCAKLMVCRRNWGLKRLPSLKCLTISEAGEKSFPEDWFLPCTVSELLIWEDNSLETLNHRGLQHLDSLAILEISDCPNIQSLPEEGLPTSLSQLEISKCPLLTPRIQRENGEDWHKICHIPIILVDYKLIT